MTHHDLKTRFHEAVNTLITAQDVSPRNKEAEAAVLDLISMSIDHPQAIAAAASTLSSSKVGALRTAFLEADREMEKYWAEAILDSAAQKNESLSWSHFDLYPWFKDYPALLDFEKRAIEKELGTITQDTHMTYIGSGALPIIPLMLSEQTGCTINCIDINQGAIDLSRKLIRGLGLDDKITVSNGFQPDKHQSLTKDHVFFLANAPLSAIEDMENIAKAIKPSLIFARASSGGTELFYPSIDKSAFANQGYSLTHIAQDHAHATHTGFVFKKGLTR